MDSLSYELVSQIASYLSAGDTLSLAATCSRVREACLSRLDPERYFQTTFKHAQYLLAAMTDYGCILSGSRALEYFVPGSIDDPDLAEAGSGTDALTPSDWDFLVPCFPASVYGMMYALSRCGVQWQHPLTDLFALVHKPAGSYIMIKSDSVYHVYPSQVAVNSMTPPSKEAMDLYRQLHSYVYVHTEMMEMSWICVEVQPGSNRTYKFERIPRNEMAERGFSPHTGRLLDPQEDGEDQTNNDGTYHDYNYNNQDSTIFLINGYITPPGGVRQKVQLFQCHTPDKKGCTPLEYVINTYYATHVQCFISGWSAGHFFYDLTRQKLAMAWGQMSDKQENALKKCVQKYRRRGFRFFRADLSDLTYNFQLCEEYDDNLSRVIHHKTNPRFVQAVYTPEHLLYAEPPACLDSQVDRMSIDFTNTHIKPSADGQPWPKQQRQKQPSGTPAPLTTLRTGRLSQQGYNDLLRYGRRSNTGRLGSPGTLLIRFKRVQDDMIDMAKGNFESQRATPSLWSYYLKLEKSLCDLRVLVMNRPKAIEPLNQKLPRLGAVDAVGQPLDTVPSLCEALAFVNVHSSEDLANRGAPPNTPPQRFNSSFKEWKYYHLLAMLTTTACFGRECHRDIAGMLPPQL
ncbi:hypothetical protein SEUCBS139899_003601 [Sporothrix eucalyptigena]|uniref:F-box domain-containing protein n=1 Tax=Sporothrix eucalyptigena TaxID=1812306 RepID=A0ABP0C9K1_9PEZI